MLEATSRVLFMIGSGRDNPFRFTVNPEEALSKAKQATIDGERVDPHSLTELIKIDIR
jgi:hypothetical protein